MSNSTAPSQNGKRRNIYIYDDTYESLVKLGYGNASAGLRRLVEERQPSTIRAIQIGDTIMHDRETFKVVGFAKRNDETAIRLELIS